MHRRWVSGLGNGLTFSISWVFSPYISNISPLSLLISLAIIRVLKSFVSVDIKVKWPNDLLFNDKKFAGVLIESWRDQTGGIVAIIGIGINFKLSDEIKLNIDNEVTDLFDMTGQFIDRNLILSALLNELIVILTDFEKFGFEPYKNEWIEHHAFHKELVILLMPDSTEVLGTVIGINDDGSVCLQTSAGIRSFVAGEISMRQFL